jgi:hypothetical protein
VPNEIFPAKTRKNVAQDHSVLPAHEDLSNGFDEVDGEKNPLGNGLLMPSISMKYYKRQSILRVYDISRMLKK